LSMGSVLRQTHCDIELLIVLDGCTDNSLEVASQLAERDSRVRVYDLPKGFHVGMENRNTVLQSATGELVAYMQHDDLWMADHLEILLKAYGEKPELQVASPQLYCRRARERT
jgi:glycosyltransferase involved in cell wall biosynthesis